MVWVIHVEIDGQRQTDSFIITAGDVGKQREVTVGRPPAKADKRPDIVVPGKSVSKIHAVLYASTDSDEGLTPNHLFIADRSRYGTFVNGSKIQGDSLGLSAGDLVQLAPKTFLMISLWRWRFTRATPDLERCKRRRREQVVASEGDIRHFLGSVRKPSAVDTGVRLTHAYDMGVTTHVLYDPGDIGWSAVVQGARRGSSVCFVGLRWLTALASGEMMPGALFSPPQLSELLLGPTQPLTRVPLPPRSSGSGLLDGFTFGFKNAWQDPGLAALLEELGGHVAAGPQDLRPDERTAAVVVLSEGDKDSGEGGGRVQTCIRAEHLLVSILLEDAMALRQLVATAYGSGSGLSLMRLKPGSSGILDHAQSPADSDMTEAAEETDAVEQQLELSSAVQAQPTRQPSVPAPSGADVSRESHAAPEPVGAVLEVDGWLAVARRSEDVNQSTAIIDAVQLKQQQATIYTDGAHEDVPALKRRRLGSAAAPTNMSGLRFTSALQAQQAHSPTPAQAPTIKLLHCLPPTTHVPVEEAPWMTSQPVSRRAITSRRSGAGLLRGVDAIAIKEEKLSPSHGTVTRPGASATTISNVAAIATKVKGKTLKTGAASADDMHLVAPHVKVEPQQPEVLDASAQVVLEADLFAPTPEQLPPRCRSESAEPVLSDGNRCTVKGDLQLPDYKQFRKQSGQMPSAVVQPLPVVLVDNFHRTEETEAFLQLEEERVMNHRRADEMFKTAGMGTKKPPRAATRRG